MFTFSVAMTVLLFIGGGVVMPYDENIGIGLYVSSPIPVLVRKLVLRWNRPDEEPPKQPPPAEDPVAPTPDEPSAV